MAKLSWFQFPSNGKLHSNPCTESKDGARIHQFQFPSNGKLHSNYYGDQYVSLNMPEISIPFKRETAFKPFNFNSKFSERRVSIPFKRETAFKRGVWGNHPFRSNCVSIPFKTGNCIQTSLSTDMAKANAEMFQFPSNGKLHSNLFLVFFFC